MSLLIKGMEMPTNGSCIQIVIDDDGNVYPSVEKCILKMGSIAKAVPVPSHGDLIDRDALCEMLEKYKDEYALKAKEDIVHLHKAWGLHEAELMAESLPTIIQTDEVV